MLGLWDAQRDWMVLLRYKKIGEKKLIDKSDRLIDKPIDRLINRLIAIELL